MFSSVRFLRNKKGSTLPELMVSVGVSAIVSLIAATAYLQGVEVYSRLIKQYEAEFDAIEISRSLHSVLSTAVNVVYAGNLTASNADTRRGAAALSLTLTRVFSYNIRDFSGFAEGTTKMLAIGTRESASPTSTTAATAQVSNFEGFGIFYQLPNSSTNESGALYIDLEPTDGWVRLSPINASQMHTRLVEFDTSSIRVRPDTGGSEGTIITAVSGTHNNMPVLSMDIRFVLRYFVSGTDDRQMWCPTLTVGSSANCTATSKYYDLEKKLNIVFRNNSFDRSLYLPERSLGKIYFFRSVRPILKQ